MTIDWDLVINGLLLLGPAFIAWIAFGWLYDHLMYRRVDRHATERWLARQRKKESDQ